MLQPQTVIRLAEIIARVDALWSSAKSRKKAVRKDVAL
jgi:hypothetical protein